MASARRTAMDMFAVVRSRSMWTSRRLDGLLCTPPKERWSLLQYPGESLNSYTVVLDQRGLFFENLSLGGDHGAERSVVACLQRLQAGRVGDLEPGSELSQTDLNVCADLVVLADSGDRRGIRR